MDAQRAGEVALWDKWPSGNTDVPSTWNQQEKISFSISVIYMNKITKLQVFNLLTGILSQMKF